MKIVSLRNQAIVVAYLENHTLDEVGKKHGLTRERIRQILNSCGIKPRSYTFLKIPAPPRITQTFSERFWGSVDKTPGQGPQGECWEFTASRYQSGYGRFASMGKTFYAHRLAYMLINRKSLKKWCLHCCDNPPCCNPKHLYDGTPADNTADMISRGRAFWMTNAGHYEKVGAKIRDKAVLASIHARLKNGETKICIAADLGVSDQTIRAIERGQGKIYRTFLENNCN